MALYDLVQFCDHSQKVLVLLSTHRVILLHTLLVKYYNDLLGRQNSERGMDEVTFFYVGDLFLFPLTLIMPIFKKKSPRRFLEKMPKLFIVTLLQ